MAVQIPITTPTSYDEYRTWLSDVRRYDLARGAREYKVFQEAFQTALTNSPVWQDFLGEMINLSQTYYIKTALELFHSAEVPVPEVHLKSYELYLEKTFRYTFVRQAAAGVGKEKPLPSDFLGKIDDVLRTLVVVKFLDGVEFLVRSLDRICSSRGTQHRVEYKCNEEGYFAAHYYFSVQVVAPVAEGGVFSSDVDFEVQITTQLQEVLRRFLHFQYEKDRSKSRPDDLPWQWRYRENEFFSNYLGHMLRNIEGQIMDARRRRNIADACAE